jgi:hypothetical protein
MPAGAFCNRYCACENSLWTVAALVLCLCGAHLSRCLARGQAGAPSAASPSRKPAAPALEPSAVQSDRAARIFCAALVLGAAAYVPFMVLHDVPMYLARHRHDQEIGKHVFGFADGVRDALERRDATRAFAAWGPEMAWRTGYFTAVVWAAILMTHAPGPAGGWITVRPRAGHHAEKRHGD